MIQRFVRYFLIICWYIHVNARNGDHRGALFGFKTSAGVYLSETSQVKHNGVVITNYFQWIRLVGGCMVGLHGDAADCEELFEALTAQERSHSIHVPGVCLGPHAVANFCRAYISDKLRSKKRLDVAALVGGVTTREDGSSNSLLYWLDDLGSLKKVKFAAHGTDTPFLLSILDQRYKEMVLDGRSGESELIDNKAGKSVTTEGEVKAARTLATDCWQQLHTRSRGKTDLGTTQLHCLGPSGYAVYNLCC